MSLAEILVVVDGAPGGDVAVEAGLYLGRTFRARVELLYVESDVETAVPLVGEGMSGAAVEQMMQSLRADAAARRAKADRLYRKYVIDKKLPVLAPDAEPVAGEFAVRFRRTTGRLPETVLHRARLSDVTVLGQRGPGGDTTAVFDTVLFDSGRPLLLIPEAPAAALGTTVAVAWDGSREAVRAVAAALPLLRRAKRVIALTAREVGCAAEPSEIARYLTSHGVTARTWAFTPDAGSLGTALLAEAAKAEADLLVMGGYGHSRVRELVLGGATRGVLAKATLPIFMMH